MTSTLRPPAPSLGIGDTLELAEDGRVAIVWKGTEYLLTWPDEDLD